MKSFTAIALGIAFRIWMIAVLMNAVLDTLLVDRLSEDVITVFLLILLFSGLFSAPVFFVLWAMVYSLLKRGSHAAFILKWLLVTGIGMAIAAWAFFAGTFHLMDSELIWLVAAAPLSGALGIYAAYPAIKKACITRDEQRNLSEGFDAVPPTTT